MRTNGILSVGLGVIGALALVGLASVLRAPEASASPAPFLSAGSIPISSLPAVLTQPGTYCLTQDVVAGVGAFGIDVQTGGVTIDLGGFEMVGTGAVQTAIRATGINNLTVRNGRIRGWGGLGIEAGSLARVVDLTVADCGDSAIRLRESSFVERCTTVNNGTSTGAHSISVNTDGTIRDCKVNNGGRPSARGYSLGDGSRIESSTCRGGAIGIEATSRATVVDCQVTGANDIGIKLGFGSTAERNSDKFSGVAIEANGSCQVLRNYCESNVLVGIRVKGERSRIEECVMIGGKKGLVLEGFHNLVIANYAIGNTLGDYTTPVPNTVGTILSDFATIQGNQPQANFKTPVL